MSDDLFSYAEEAARAGMKLAADHADGVTAGWTDIAYSFLVRFAKEHEFFISEDVSGASKETDFPQPPTDRAWGSVYRRAIKDLVIERAGAGKSARRHNSICPRWRSLLF